MNQHSILNIEIEHSTTLKILLGRRPILDRQQKLAGYKILFRIASAENHNASSSDAAIHYAADIGMEKLIGRKPGFLAVSQDILLDDVVLFLPQGNIILTILGSMTPSDEIIERIAELRKIGFKFALDLELGLQEAEKILPMMHFVRFAFDNLRRSTAAAHLRQLKAAQKKLLVTDVDDVSQFELCCQLGCDYFEGDFYAKPVMNDSKFSPSEVAIIKILGLLNQDASDAEIERVIKQNGSIALNLLKLVNSAAIGANQRIGSLKQAFQLIGRAQLARWLQVMLYQKPEQQGSGEGLFLQAMTRAKLLELIAYRVLPNSRIAADIGFMVGIMSLMETLFGKPMETVLEQIAVYNEVKMALLERQGVYGELLSLVEYIEQVDKSNPTLLPILEQFELSTEELYMLEQDAFAWVDQLA